MASSEWRGKAEQRITEGLQALSLTGTKAQVTQLLDYLALLHKWNKVYNLTAVREPLQMVTRHILDSLAVLPYLSGLRCIDVGTGAGLPGIPLAIMRPDREFVLVDSNNKKTRFVQQAVNELGLNNVTVVQSRIEDYARDQAQDQAYDVVLSRAFASLADMLSHTRQLCAPAGEFLAMKGAVPESELQAVPSDYTVSANHELVVPGLNETRHLVCIRRSECAVNE